MTEQEQANFDAFMQRQAEIGLAKQVAMNENLPSWAQVSAACDNISSLAEAKAFLKKLSRVVYWIARNSEV